MGYRIEYGVSGAEKKPNQKRIQIVPVVAVCAAVLVFGAFLFPKGRAAIRDLILPGDGAVTEQALQGLVSDLHDGVSVGDAVTVFCQEIIAGGTQ